MEQYNLLREAEYNVKFAERDRPTPIAPRQNRGGAIEQTPSDRTKKRRDATQHVTM